jgi:hypothetical protein
MSGDEQGHSFVGNAFWTQNAAFREVGGSRRRRIHGGDCQHDDLAVHGVGDCNYSHVVAVLRDWSVAGEQRVERRVQELHRMCQRSEKDCPAESYA